MEEPWWAAVYRVKQVGQDWSGLTGSLGSKGEMRSVASCCRATNGCASGQLLLFSSLWPQLHHSQVRGPGRVFPLPHLGTRSFRDWAGNILRIYPRQKEYALAWICALSRFSQSQLGAGVCWLSYVKPLNSWLWPKEKVGVVVGRGPHKHSACHSFTTNGSVCSRSLPFVFPLSFSSS